MSSVTSYRTEAAIKLLDQLDLVDLNVLLKDDNDVTNWLVKSQDVLGTPDPLDWLKHDEWSDSDTNAQNGFEAPKMKPIGNFTLSASLSSLSLKRPPQRSLQGPSPSVARSLLQTSVPQINTLSSSRYSGNKVIDASPETPSPLQLPITTPVAQPRSPSAHTITRNIGDSGADQWLSTSRLPQVRSHSNASLHTGMRTSTLRLSNGRVGSDHRVSSGAFKTQ